MVEYIFKKKKSVFIKIFLTITCIILFTYKKKLGVSHLKTQYSLMKIG